jgi:hypothetical protein
LQAATALQRQADPRSGGKSDRRTRRQFFIDSNISSGTILDSKKVLQFKNWKKYLSFIAILNMKEQ